MARPAYCMFEGLLRWCRKTFIETGRDPARARQFRPVLQDGRHLLVNMAEKLSPELIKKIVVQAELHYSLDEPETTEYKGWTWA